MGCRASLRLLSGLHVLCLNLHVVNYTGIESCGKIVETCWELSCWPGEGGRTRVCMSSVRGAAPARAVSRGGVQGPYNFFKHK